MAPAYKLTYFDMRGLGEAVRLLLKYGGIEFEDVRVSHADWPQMKDKTPFGQLPILEHNGKKVDQSVSICRYLGKLVKLAGKDDWENLEIDAIADTFTDFRSKLVAANFEQDEAKKKTQRETLLNETLPYYFSRLDAMAAKNNGFLALGRLTWADLFFVSLVPAIDGFVGGKALEKYPNLKAVNEKVNALPAIKKWIEERPKTEF